MWVKICANTSRQDALHAAECGADAIGFVLAPSKRQVTPGQVRDITAALPSGVERVGVFGYLPVAEIAAAAEFARLTTVQLHGLFNPDYSARLSGLLGPGIALIQTVHWALDEPTAAAAVEAGLADLQQAAPGRRALLDAKVSGHSGGLGVAFDWPAAAQVLARHRSMNVVLAGGLRPDTVTEAIRIVQPWGVDVASGVEREPGTKDPEKVAAFIKNARGA